MSEPLPCPDDRWTIRGVSIAERSAAKRAADKAGLSIGDWTTRAIVAAIKADRAATNLPAVVGHVGQAVSDMSDNGELTLVERVAEQVRGLTEAGVPVSKTQAGRVVAALTRHLPKRRTGVSDMSDKNVESGSARMDRLVQEST